MKRLLRILLNIATAASLLLFLACALLWPRGYFTADGFFWQSYADHGDRSYWIQDTVHIGSGGVGMSRIVQSSPITGAYGPERRRTAEFKAQDTYPFHLARAYEYPNFHVGVGDEPVWGGFKYGAFSRPDPGHDRPRVYAWQVVLPFWFVTPLAAILPALWLWRRHRRRRHRAAGLCPACGYNLTGNISGVCPECGTAVAHRTDVTA